MNPDQFAEDPRMVPDPTDSEEMEADRRNQETRPFHGTGLPNPESVDSKSDPGGSDSGPQTSRTEDPEVTPIRPVRFSQIEGDGESGPGSLELLMDVKLPVSVELGRSEVLIKEILEYGTGSVIQLNKGAGDPVDILINGRLVAQGEVVVVDDHFGVRISMLLSPQDRARSLA